MLGGFLVWAAPETLRTFCEAALQLPSVAFAYAPHPGPGRDGLVADRELIEYAEC